MTEKSTERIQPRRHSFSLSLYLSLSLSEEMEETDIAGGFPLLLRHPGVLWTVPAAGALCPALASSLKTVA